MLKAVIWKEVRELLPLFALAMLAQIYLMCAATGTNLGQLASFLYFMLPGRTDRIPFIYDQYCIAFFVVVGLLAIAVGLWQTLWEINHGTLLFLFHRPIQRNAVIGAKLLVGILLCVLAAVLPLLYYAIWAATPGTNPSPFAWSMTTHLWILCVQMPLVYLGAFLSGLRSARWYGSRFFPLFATLGCLFLLLAIQELAVGNSWWWTILVLAALVIEASIIVAILYVSKTRDFS